MSPAGPSFWDSFPRLKRWAECSRRMRRGPHSHRTPFQVAVADSIRTAIIANGTHMFTGNLATSFIFRRGVHSGLSDVIYGSLAQVRKDGMQQWDGGHHMTGPVCPTLLQVDYPSYGFMLSTGATSLYESVCALHVAKHQWLPLPGSPRAGTGKPTFLRPQAAAITPGLAPSGASCTTELEALHAVTTRSSVGVVRSTFARTLLA